MLSGCRPLEASMLFRSPFLKSIIGGASGTSGALIKATYSRIFSISLVLYSSSGDLPANTTNSSLQRDQRMQQPLPRRESLAHIPQVLLQTSKTHESAEYSICCAICFSDLAS